LCNPKLFDNVRPSKPQRVIREKALKRVTPVDSVRMALYGWRREIKAKHWPCSMWGSQAILDDNTCEFLASVGPVESEVFLSSVLKSSWQWWDKLGTELFSFLHDLNIPPLPQTSRASRGTKRHPPTSDSAQNPRQSTPSQIQGPGSPSKRARHTAANLNLALSTNSAPTLAPTLAGSHTRRTRDLVLLEFAPTLYDGFWSSFSNTAK
jgi:hypothetical protein